MKIHRALIVFVAVAMSLGAMPHADGEHTSGGIEWVHQFGSSSEDSGSAVAVDRSGVYVSGRTLGTAPADDHDAFLRKYDFNGIMLWVRQFGTESFDYGSAVAVDGSSAYVAGHTGGNLGGVGFSSGVDAYVRKYDIDGNVAWTRQFGSADFDTALAIAVNGTGAYVAGYTEGTIPGETRLGSVDAFLRKYDGSGNVSWTHQFGTSVYDVAAALVVDGTGVYVAGQTGGSFPGETLVGGVDAFVRKYDVNGDVLWTRQFGTIESTIASALAVDATGVYIAGQAAGSFPGERSGGGADAFLRKYDIQGNMLWTRQFGSLRGDAAFAVAVNQSGVYVTGQTDGLLPGETSAGSADAFLQKYDVNGTLLGTLQFGTSGFDRGNGVAVGGSGVYVAGDTNGAFLEQTNSGGLDAFLVSPREPLPAPVEGPPEGARLWVGFAAGVAIVIALLAGVLLVRWWILRPRQ